ncbi:MAG: ABC transporter ATP-binding protein [Nitrospirota bacterium]
MWKTSIVIRADSVSKVFNKGKPDEVNAVVGVTVEIRRGDFVVFKGPSGSGKTTLLSLIGCMSRPTSGRIYVEDRDVTRLPERFLTDVRRKTFGFIFQQLNLIPGISVIENIMLPLYSTGTRISKLKVRADEIISSLDLSHRRDFEVRGLSGGEQQRVAIARALINSPDVVLADEPTAHLDTKLSEEFLYIMEGIRKQGKTVVIATHDPLVYEKPYVSMLIEMRDGRVVGIRN